MLTYIRSLACTSPFFNKCFVQRNIYFLVSDKLPVDSSLKLGHDHLIQTPLHTGLFTSSFKNVLDLEAY